MNKSIGFIGAGNMGRPFIVELLRQGFAVSVHDIDPNCASWAHEHGAFWALTPAQAAEGASVLITCLPLPCHVRQMMTGPDGALAGLSAGAVWVDTSTTDYHNTLEIAELAAARGVLSLEAPVSNLSHMGVDFNNVCFYAGGTASAYAQVEPVLRVMGEHALHVGAIGSGQSVKLLTNLLFYCATLVWGELLIVAQTHGIDLHWLWETAKKSRGNCFVVDQITPLLLDGSYDHSCTLEITVKDTALVVSLADELDVPLALGRLVEQRYRQSCYSYPPRVNHLKVLHMLERENDRRLQIPGFTAPSPYGVNRDYRHPTTLHTDARGRVKPHVPQQYGYTLSHPAWAHHAECLMEVMALSNALILREALELGRAMGLGDELLDQVVSMSCGPSWVSDNPHVYQPNRPVLREFAGLVADLHLPILQTLNLGTPSTPHLAGHCS
jgi:3-hydroxyisobutyrate dehydrogenase